MANPETTLDGVPSARRQRLARFLVEVLVSIVLSVLPFLIVEQLIAQRNIGVAAVLFLFAWHGNVWLLYGIPPSIVLIAGILLRRSGVIAGPALLVGGFFLALLDVQTHQQIMLHDFAPEEIADAAGAHSMVALEGPAVAEDQKVEEGPACGVLCRRVIATSPYAFAKRTSSDLWTVYRRLPASDCQSDEFARSTLSFLFDGYIGVCAVATTQADMTDALLYRAGVLTDEMRARLRAIPSSTTLEIVERSNDEDRVLGRQFIGGLFHWAPLPLAYPSDRLADLYWSGPALGRRAFVAWVLHVPVAELANKHRAPLKDVLDAIESFIARPAVSVPAIETWGYVADARAREDRKMILPRVEAFLRSNEPKRIEAGLRALNGLGGERDAMQAPLVELAFNPLLGEKDSPIADMLRPILGGCGFVDKQPFPPEIRTRATSAFVSTPTLNDGQRVLFFRMILCGGLDTRHEAIDALMSLHGPTFTATVEAIGHNGHAAFIWNGPDHWLPDEVDRLIDRAAEVPNSDLAAYVGAFSYYEWMSDPQRARLREQLHARLDIAKAAPARDEEAIKVLSSLINQMRPLGR